MPEQIKHITKKHPIELIIFDCDGVLIDSEILSNQIMHQELLRLGHALTLEQYLEIGVGRRREEEELLLAQKNIFLPENFWKTTQAKILDSLSKDLKPIAGIKEVLETLTTKKCIASGSSRERLKVSLSATHLSPYFTNLIFDGEMVARGKPYPDIFLLAAHTLGVDPKHCLVIEDSLPGIQAASAAGMRAWGFTGGLHCFPEYVNKIQASSAERVFNDMHQLPMLLENEFYAKALKRQGAMRNFLGI